MAFREKGYEPVLASFHRTGHAKKRVFCHMSKEDTVYYLSNLFSEKFDFFVGFRCRLMFVENHISLPRFYMDPSEQVLFIFHLGKNTFSRLRLQTPAAFWELIQNYFNIFGKCVNVKAMKPLKTENKRPKSSQNFKDLYLVCAAKETNPNLSVYL
jgi:hypothetical protein